MTEKICPECNGEGVVDQGTEDERRCPTCNGCGVVPDDDGQGSEEVWNANSDRLSPLPICGARPPIAMAHPTSAMTVGHYVPSAVPRSDKTI
jgi:RecJ-like exonuclease